MSDDTRLRIVKTAHTVVWAFFVACIVGAPIAAWHGRFDVALVLAGLVALEGIVLLANRWTCPLTSIASRYTDRTEENFDIHLPRWLAKHNKTIFTPLYLAGTVYVLVAWWRHG